MNCLFVVCAPPDPPPVITSSPVFDVQENRMLALTLTANEAVTWSIDSGVDMHQFEIVNGVLRWIGNGTRDYENPADNNFNNVYQVIIRATDAGSNYALQTVNVTVTDVDDTNPEITSPNNAYVNENALLAHQLTANEPVTWSIMSGADSAQFELSGSKLRWAGDTSKDFETPDDSNLDNAYVVTVRATDLAGNYNQQTVTITVVDVDEIKWATFKDGDNTNITLTAADVGVAPTTGTGGRALAVASTAWKRSGKHYFEVTRLGNGWWEDRPGLVIEGFAYDNLVYGTAMGFGIPINCVGLVEWNGGRVQVWGYYGSLIDLGNWNVDQVVCYAVDLDNYRMWIKLGANGPWLNNWGVDPPVPADPNTNLNGIDISHISQTRVALTAAFTGWEGGKFLFNTGDSPFQGVVPTGFAPGWSTGSQPARGHTTYAYMHKMTGTPEQYNYIEEGELQFMRLMGGTVVPYGGARIHQNDFKAHGSGKFYFELHAVGVSSTIDTYGLQTWDATDAQIRGLNSGVYITHSYFRNGSIHINGADTGLGTDDAVGNKIKILSIALDRINAKVWFRMGNGFWNGQPASNPATNSGGVDISVFNSKALGLCCVSGNTFDGTRVLFNMGGAPFANPVPAGFIQGWPRNPPDTIPPTITSATSANNAEDTALAHTLTANEYADWTIVGGPDAGNFEIVGRTLRWLGNGTKDYQSPTDANADNTYFVTVRGTDESGNFSTQTIGVSVFDPNPPLITSPPTTYDNMEGTVLALPLTANEPVTWAIIGGADQARFEISGTTLRWLGNGVKSFGAPNDADGNNTYVVTVRAIDVSANTTTQTITVSVLSSAVLAASPMFSASRAGLPSMLVGDDGTKVTIIPGIGAVT